MKIINWFVLISSTEHSDSVLFVFGVRCALNQLRLCFEANPLAFHHGSRESRRQKECFKAVKCCFSLSSACLVTIIILHHLMSTARTAPPQSIEKKVQENLLFVLLKNLFRALPLFRLKSNISACSIQYGKMPNKQQQQRFGCPFFPSYIITLTGPEIQLVRNQPLFFIADSSSSLSKSTKNLWMLLSRLNLCECVNCEIFFLRWCDHIFVNWKIFSFSIPNIQSMPSISDNLRKYHCGRSILHCYHDEAKAPPRSAIVSHRWNAIFMEIWWYDEWK